MQESSGAERLPECVQELPEEGRAWDTGMRAGTGGSLVHTGERLQVEKQNHGRNDAVQKRKNGNWGLGGSFYKL